MTRLCVDAYIVHVPLNKIVLIRRLSEPKGIAFVGGKIDQGEHHYDAIIREVKEETGFDFKVVSWLPGTVMIDDPRGVSESYVAIGYTHTPIAQLRNEPGKTEVLLLSNMEAFELQGEWALPDHFDLFRDIIFHHIKPSGPNP